MERLLHGQRLCPAAVGMSAGNTTSTRTKLALSFFFADLTDQSTMAPIACPLAETHLKAWKIEQSARAPPPTCVMVQCGGRKSGKRPKRP
jgi:hypothetical protein